MKREKLMRISAKGRYGLAAMISMAQDSSKGEYITIISISEKLGISKIYLEQVFSLLKKEDLVVSTKGSSGGYQLARPSNKITAYDIISAIEQTLFEKTKKSVSDDASHIEIAMQELVFDKIDNAIIEELKSVTLYDLLTEAQRHNDNNNIMYYI
jgi:Rrf2 family protein